jgi:predicted RNA-binding protein YlqC (UPF0109 family)
MGMKDLIAEIVQAIVDQPDQVLITEIEGDHTNVLELSVAKSDMGKVIGRKGRTAQANRLEDYRRSSIDYHLQTENKGQFRPTDFGLKEFNVKSPKELMRNYHRCVYEAGAISRPDEMQAKVIDDKVLAKEHKKDFEISRISRFRYRTRYFTDSGIIGSKEFVAENYQRFKHLFHSKHEKKPKLIKGLEGMYSLKRLSEVV